MIRISLAALALVIVLAGCKKEEVKETVAKTESSGAGVDRIVFAGLKDACQCTRNRIDASWAALENVLGKDSAIAVERIQLDVDTARADQFEKLKPTIVVPGIYFLDEKGKLVELLQGEVNAEQVSAVLQKSGT